MYGLLFEPLDGLTANTINKVILNLIENWEPRVKVLSLTVNPDFDTNTYNLSIEFDIIGVNNPQTLETNLKRLR